MKCSVQRGGKIREGIDNVTTLASDTKKSNAQPTKKGRRVQKTTY